jgi:hypothetical protein
MVEVCCIFIIMLLDNMLLVVKQAPKLFIVGHDSYLKFNLEYMSSYSRGTPLFGRCHNLQCLSLINGTTKPIELS